MGTDIHTYVERKVDNVWIMVPEEYGPTDPYSGRNRWSLDRSYLLFSILGGVRGDLDPIIKVRGCPVDISKEVFDSFSSWGKEAHSHSYYLLSELLNGKKLSYFEEYLVNLAEWKEYKKGNKDLSGIYYGHRCDYNIVSNQEMDRIESMSVMLGDNKYATKVNINREYGEINEYFWETFVPAMQKLDANPDNVRLIFWFDN